MQKILCKILSQGKDHKSNPFEKENIMFWFDSNRLNGTWQDFGKYRDCKNGGG